MINVLELIDGGFIGGGQTHIMSLVKNLDRSEYNPVIAASADGEFKNVVMNSGVEFRDIELSKLYRSKHLKKLKEIVEENSINIIHSHGGVAGMYARFFKKKFNDVRVIHTIHGIHYVNSNVFRKFFTLSIEQFLVPFTDRFICVSDSDFDKAKAHRIIDAEKTSVIKNGIDINRFSEKKKNEELISKYKQGEKDFIIGNISRFDYQKNQRSIITAADEILRKHPSVKILLAGEGRYLEECKALVSPEFKERIIFTGLVTDPENYYPLIDIFVFPSLWEGLSITLIEAMAASSCILASDIPPNRELIRDHHNGLLFSLSEKEKFLKLIDDLIEDRTLREKLSKNAGDDAKSFSESVMTKKTEEEYNKLIKQT